VLELEDKVAAYRRDGRRIVTTNGCFDVIHAGHLSLLEQARALGDVLIVGINSDDSVRRLKGADRPKMNAADRVRVISALKPVDDVVVFESDLPLAFLDTVRPNIHVKGGDYDADKMPETALVRKNGGEVRVIPLIEGRSSSLAVLSDSDSFDPVSREILLEHLRWSNVVRQTGYQLSQKIAAEAQRMFDVLANSGRILVCGNGGSACDADHFAAEMIGRFRHQRDGVPVFSLSSGSGVLTSLANDFGYADIFRLQVVALAKKGDLLLAISTSGKSQNVLRALTEARARGVYTVLLTGKSGGPARVLADSVLDIPSDDTADIQQGHRAVIHSLCARIDEWLAQTAKKVTP
jgi:rfaE bifunctional protein nucleotidyltransferase chain/domain